MQIDTSKGEENIHFQLEEAALSWGRLYNWQNINKGLWQCYTKVLGGSVYAGDNIWGKIDE